jgi:hypothetical protein
VARPPDALWGSTAERCATKGQTVKSVRRGLERACRRAGIRPHANAYSFRHVAVGWRRGDRGPPWEVAAQLGHGVGKAYAVSERYAAYSPDYLSGAVEALDGLLRVIVCSPVAGQNGGTDQESRSSSGVEQRIRNAWVGGSIPSCGTNGCLDLLFWAMGLRPVPSLSPAASSAVISATPLGFHGRGAAPAVLSSRRSCWHSQPVYRPVGSAPR